MFSIPEHRRIFGTRFAELGFQSKLSTRTLSALHRRFQYIQPFKNPTNID